MTDLMTLLTTSCPRSLKKRGYWKDMFQEMVETRNTADGLIHATKKTMDDEKVVFEDGEKEAIETAIAALEEAMKGDDKDAITAKTEELSKVSQKMYEISNESFQKFLLQSDHLAHSLNPDKLYP